MKTFVTLSIVCLLSMMAGCMGVKFTSEASDGADFASKKTFSWVPDQKNQFYNPIYAEYYMEATNSQLAAKGYKLDQKAPDFLIRTHYTKDKKATVISISHGTVTFHKGTIYMELVDAASGGVIYKGEAETYLSDEPKQDEVKKSVEGLFKNLPSAGKD